MADFNKVAPHFPAWDVIDYRGLDIGLVTNFEGVNEFICHLMIEKGN